MKTVAFHNLGCKVNSYETDIMQQLFVQNGYEVVPFGQTADVTVVNTCTVTNMADRKSRQMLHKAKAINPSGIVIATGCYVQTDTENARKDPSIDIIIGNNKKAEVINILEAYINDRSEREQVIDINHTGEYETMFLSNTAERTRAYIKIQDGCNQFCSYCLIPYARGRVRSRDMQDILKEIETLSQSGYQEFVLTGIHVSSYGIENPNDLSQNKLAELIEEIHKLPLVKRIRLSSLEPRVVTEDFARRISALGKVCPHFHLSLQSGCDETLKRMNRHYTAGQYMEGVSILRRYFDDPAITTDVIVGFPGETDEEFEASYEFCKSVGFYEMHIFKYSKRKGTVAEKLPNQVKDADKDIRSDRMLELSETLSKEFINRHLGKQAQILFEDSEKINGRKYMTGFTPEYIRVYKETEDNLSNVISTETLDKVTENNIIIVK